MGIITNKIKEEKMINDLVTELKSIQEFVKTNNDAEWIDLRLRFFENVYSLLWGDPSMDTDHRGFWGFASIHIDSDLDELTMVIEDMVREIEDQLILEEMCG